MKTELKNVVGEAKMLPLSHKFEEIIFGIVDDRDFKITPYLPLSGMLLNTEFH
jgi:hypothetical protein